MLLNHDVCPTSPCPAPPVDHVSAHTPRSVPLPLLRLFNHFFMCAWHSFARSHNMHLWRSLFVAALVSHLAFANGQAHDNCNNCVGASFAWYAARVAVYQQSRATPSSGTRGTSMVMAAVTGSAFSRRRARRPLCSCTSVSPRTGSIACFADLFPRFVGSSCDAATRALNSDYASTSAASCKAFGPGITCSGCTSVPGCMYGIHSFIYYCFPSPPFSISLVARYSSETSFYVGRLDTRGSCEPDTCVSRFLNCIALTLLQVHLPRIQCAMQNAAVIQLRLHGILRQLRLSRRETPKVGRRAFGVARHHSQFWFTAGFYDHVRATAVCRQLPFCIPHRARSKVLRKETWRFELSTVGPLFLAACALQNSTYIMM